MVRTSLPMSAAGPTLLSPCGVGAALLALFFLALPVEGAGRETPGKTTPLPEGSLRRLGLPKADLPHSILALVFSPDGTVLASASREPELCLWDPATGKQRAHVKVPDTVFSLCFTPDGKGLVTGGHDGTVRLLDPTTGKEVRVLHRGGHAVTSVSLAPNGKTLACSGADGTSIELLEVGSGKTVRTLSGGHDNGVDSVAFAPDGRTLASTSHDHTVCLWDPADGRVLQRLGKAGAVPSRIRGMGPVEGVRFSPDGTLLASWGAYGPVRLWNVKDGAEVRQWKVQPSLPSPVTFSPDGRVLAIGSHSAVVFEDVGGGKELLRVPGFRSWAGPVAFSPDGKFLATGCADSSILLWDFPRLLARGQK